MNVETDVDKRAASEGETARADRYAPVITIMGAPGAGKGTQARLLAERFGIPQISTGDILRELAKTESTLGHEIREAQNAGRLVSDAVLARVVLSRTCEADCRRGYILDGYPRTIAQAHTLEDLTYHRGNIVACAVVVEAEVLMKRLTGRRTCTLCGEIYNVYFAPPAVQGVCDRDGAPLVQRSDDTADTVWIRLSNYERATTPLFDYYRESGRLYQIDGHRDVHEILRDLVAVLEPHLG